MVSVVGEVAWYPVETPGNLETLLRYRHESEVVGHRCDSRTQGLSDVPGVIIDVTRQLLTDVHDLAPRSSSWLHRQRSWHV